MRAAKRIAIVVTLIVAVIALSGQALAARSRYVLPGPNGSTVFVFSSGRNIGGLRYIFRDIYGPEWATILRYIVPLGDWDLPDWPSLPPEVPTPPAEPPAEPNDPPASPQEPPADPDDPPAEPDDPPTGDDVLGMTAAEEAMLELVNQERQKAGLKPLAPDLELVKLARMKSQDMIDKGYFDHNSPTYGSPFDMMREAGISYRTAGENLAGAGTVAQAHSALMNSDGHRRNILNPNFDHIGIGIIEGGPYGMMFTQMFTGQ